MARVKKISGESVYYAMQDFLIGENGSPTLSEPYRDEYGDPVFEDCNGNEIGLDWLVDWYNSLVEEGLITDLLGMSGKNAEVVDDFDFDEDDEEE